MIVVVIVIIQDLVVVLGAANGDAAGGGDGVCGAAGCLGVPSRRPCLDQSAPGLRAICRINADVSSVLIQ